MKHAEKPLDDAERGVWERAWQRVYKRAVRAGEATAGARAEAKAAAWAAVERLRAGGGEEDHGRRRVPPEERGARSRERQDATVAIPVDGPLFARVLARAEAAGITPREWTEAALRRALSRPASGARGARG